MCCVAGNLLSLALDAMPQCVGQLITRDISRCDRVTHIVQTLMTHGAVLVPYLCCGVDNVVRNCVT